MNDYSHIAEIALNESTRVFNAKLAKLIGLNEAIMLRQIHYWISHPASQIREGKKWHYDTYEGWQTQFEFWSIRTIQRIAMNLEELGLVEVGHFNENKTDRTKWYTINYERLQCLYIGTTCQFGTLQHANLASSEHANLAHCTYTKNTYEDINNINNNYITEVDLTRAREDELDFLSPPNDKKQPVLSNISIEQKEFEEFWKEYPNKVKKMVARDVFRVARTKVTTQHMIVALRAQKLEKDKLRQAQAFCPEWPAPNLWLKQERWDDCVKADEEIRSMAKPTHATQNKIAKSNRGDYLNDLANKLQDRFNKNELNIFSASVRSA